MSEDDVGKNNDGGVECDCVGVAVVEIAARVESNTYG